MSFQQVRKRRWCRLLLREAVCGEFGYDSELLSVFDEMNNEYEKSLTKTIGSFEEAEVPLFTIPLKPQGG